MYLPIATQLLHYICVLVNIIMFVYTYACLFYVRVFCLYRIIYLEKNIYLYTSLNILSGPGNPEYKLGLMTLS